jgi:hypothetical protein
MTEYVHVHPTTIPQPYEVAHMLAESGTNFTSLPLRLPSPSTPVGLPILNHLTELPMTGPEKNEEHGSCLKSTFGWDLSTKRQP